MGKHWHFNKEKNFGYIECLLEDCNEPIVEEHVIPEILSTCFTCGVPKIRTSPYSWKSGCEHNKTAELVCA